MEQAVQLNQSTKQSSENKLNPNVKSVVVNLDTNNFFTINSVLYAQEFPIQVDRGMIFSHVYESETDAFRHGSNPLESRIGVMICPQGLSPLYTCSFTKNYIVEQLVRLQEVVVHYKLEDLSITFQIRKMSDSKSEKQEIQHITDLQKHYNLLQSILVNEMRVNLFIKYNVHIKTKSERHHEFTMTFGIVNFITEQFKLQFTTSLNKKLHSKPQIPFLQHLQKEFQYDVDLIYVNYTSTVFEKTKQNKDTHKMQLDALRCFYQISKDISQLDEPDLSLLERSNYNTDIYESQLAILKQEYENLLQEKKAQLKDNVDKELQRIYSKFIASQQNKNGNAGEVQHDKNSDANEIIKSDTISNQYERYIKRQKKITENNSNNERAELVNQYGPLYERILNGINGEQYIESQVSLQQCLSAVRKKLEVLQDLDLDMQIQRNQEIIARGQEIARSQYLKAVPLEEEVQANEKAREKRKLVIMNELQKDMQYKKYSELYLLCKKYNIPTGGKKQKEKAENPVNNTGNRNTPIADTPTGANILKDAGMGSTILLKRSTNQDEKLQSFDYIDYSSFAQIRITVNRLPQSQDNDKDDENQENVQIMSDLNQATQKLGSSQGKPQNNSAQSMIMVFSPIKTARFLEAVTGQDLYMTENYTNEVPEELKEQEDVLKDLGFTKFYSNYGLLCLWKNDQRVLIATKHEVNYVIHRLKQKAEQNVTIRSRKAIGGPVRKGNAQRTNNIGSSVRRSQIVGNQRK